MLTVHICVSDDECTYWKIPAAGAYSWVAFDLGSEFTLTGLRLAGWYVYIMFVHILSHCTYITYIHCVFVQE